MNERTLTPEEAESWSRYQRMRARLAERLNRELSRETGLSEAEFEVLLALADAPVEAVRALALRCGLEWEKSRLSHQLRRMEQRGLIRREHCEEDNRGSIVRITDTGRELAEVARRVHQQAVLRYVCDPLTDRQMAALDEITAAILARLEETAASEPPSTDSRSG